MSNLQTQIKNYLEYCYYQKRLDEKTLKAYRIDLTQFQENFTITEVAEITSDYLESYIAYLHQTFKPKTAKRKIATLKSFFHYLEFKDQIKRNPFARIQVKFREPIILPKTIPLHTIEIFLSTIYKQYNHATTTYQKRNSLRDAAVIELLFATGIRISELCNLKTNDINLYERTLNYYLRFLSLVSFAPRIYLIMPQNQLTVLST